MYTRIISVGGASSLRNPGLVYIIPIFSPATLVKRFKFVNIKKNKKNAGDLTSNKLCNIGIPF